MVVAASWMLDCQLSGMMYIFNSPLPRCCAPPTRVHTGSECVHHSNPLDDHPEEVENDLAHGQIFCGGVQLQKSPLHRSYIMIETLNRFSCMLMPCLIIA